MVLCVIRTLFHKILEKEWTSVGIFNYEGVLITPKPFKNDSASQNSKSKKLHLMYVAHPATRGANFRAAYTFVNCQFFELRP